jgi:hypothetical protein
MLALSPQFLQWACRWFVGLEVNINPLDSIDGTIASAAEVQEVPERHVRDERGKSYGHDDITHRPDVLHAPIVKPPHRAGIRYYKFASPIERFIGCYTLPYACPNISIRRPCHREKES